MTAPRFRDRLAGLSTGSARRPLPVLIGSVLAPLGLVLIGLGWLGASRTPLVQEQLPYLISGGLLGLALVVLGGFLYFAHWQTEVLREVRAQTAEITAALRAGAAPLPYAGALVTTGAGTLAHRPDCPVVRGRADLSPAGPELAPCSICEPVLTGV
ncbi:MAG: hypothetical protein ABR549_10840 [Mycobacteriales bacterium]